MESLKMLCSSWLCLREEEKFTHIILYPSALGSVIMEL